MQHDLSRTATVFCVAFCALFGYTFLVFRTKLHALWRTTNYGKVRHMKFSRIIFGCPEGARKWHIIYFAMLLHSKIHALWRTTNYGKVRRMKFSRINIRIYGNRSFIMETRFEGPRRNDCFDDITVEEAANYYNKSTIL